jgi:hypothetical protein
MYYTHDSTFEKEEAKRVAAQEKRRIEGVLRNQIRRKKSVVDIYATLRMVGIIPDLAYSSDRTAADIAQPYRRAGL